MAQSQAGKQVSSCCAVNITNHTQIGQEPETGTQCQREGATSAAFVDSKTTPTGTLTSSKQESLADLVNTVS